MYDKASLRVLHDRIEELSSQISQTITRIERYATGLDYFESDDYAEEDAILSLQLEQFHVYLSTLLEAAALPQNAKLLNFEFEALKPKLTSLDVNDGVMYSTSLGAMYKYLTPVSDVLGNVTSSTFEAILRNTPKIISDRGIIPETEAEVRKAVYDVLIHIYPDTVREIPLPQPTKTYRADLGVKSLRAVAEYKFFATEAKARAHIGGIYEDMVGYSGSQDWTKFYAVLYMADHFFTKEQIEEEFKLGKNENWDLILVFGRGARKKRDA